MFNTDVRSSIRNAGLYQYMVADRIGVTEATFTRWLRKELPDSKKKEIFKAIADLKQEMAANE